jgi:hypothetical protein
MCVYMTITTFMTHHHPARSIFDNELRFCEPIQHSHVLFRRTFGPSQRRHQMQLQV